MIIFLIFIATILLFLEFILPSLGLLSIGAVLCFLYAIFIAFSSYGAFWGFVVVAICLGLALLAIAFAIKAFPKMKLTKKLSINTEETPVIDDSADFVGKRGVALTALALSGKVEIDGVEYDAQSNLDFIEKGSEIEVVAKDSFKLIVKAC
ncbi:MAG: NfeD family protein [Opitutales bacterium]